MNTIQVHLRLPIGLVEELDLLLSRLGTNSRVTRQDFIVYSLRAELDRRKSAEAEEQ